MNKLRLDLTALAVQTMVMGVGSTGANGTIEAYGMTYEEQTGLTDCSVCQETTVGLSNCTPCQAEGSDTVARANIEFAEDKKLPSVAEGPTRPTVPDYKVSISITGEDDDEGHPLQATIFFTDGRPDDVLITDAEDDQVRVPFDLIQVIRENGQQNGAMMVQAGPDGNWVRRRGYYE